ncbi:ATP-grasp domain-containing protein [Rhodohalobacter mucosus]|uniref:ATP-grasp domain-containing protein n=1 Tax=Rhodohalobacter mucosus TaxID=2079485 RepID=A0A316TWN8_9BACT|nr:ATP-grasp domain-containing protein [Rhodohalobacter mucosus]PWN07799.1 hypothetical protein DDZ15_01950 [Rhodohalobacter mucosus]
MKVLVLDPGRQALPFLKSLTKKGHDVIMICFNRFSLTYYSRYPSQKIFWPNYNVYQDKFLECLLDYIKHNQVDVTLALGDVTAEILSKNKSEISKYTKITSPDYETYDQTTDKLKLMQFCMQHKIPCPKTYELSDSSDLNVVSEHLTFPVIVKPRKGIGAIGVTKVSSLEELKVKLTSMRKDFGELLIQEYIPFEQSEQYQAEFFLNGNQEICAGVIISKPRFFPVYGGTSTANLSIKNDEIFSVGKELLQKLKWQGAADIDFILDKRTGEPKVIEVNPRVTAGIKIAFKAGVDFADLHMKLAKNQIIERVQDYTVGIYCRNLILDLLWWFFSTKKMKKETKPSFYKFFGKDVCYQAFSLDDPFTGLGFILNMIYKYSNIKEIKKKIFT